MGFRFFRDLRAPSLMIKIVNTYITPLIEFNSIIWNQSRVALNDKLDTFLHKSTRQLLATAYRPHQPGYVEFEQRLLQIHLLTYDERRSIAAAIFILKIYKGCLQSTYSQKIISSKFENTVNLRSPQLFRIDRKIPLNSPLYNCLVAINEFSNTINIDDSIDISKRKMKEYYHLLRESRFA